MIFQLGILNHLNAEFKEKKNKIAAKRAKKCECVK